MSRSIGIWRRVAADNALRTAGGHSTSFGPLDHKLLRKLEFGGESPLTMRHGRWVVKQHPLGPSTISCYEQTVFVCNRRGGHWPPATKGSGTRSVLTVKLKIPKPFGRPMGAPTVLVTIPSSTQWRTDYHPACARIICGIAADTERYPKV